MLADREKDGLRAMLRQRVEHGARVAGPGTVVESEHHFLEQQEIVRLVLLEAKARAAGGVDLHRARQPQCVGIGARALSLRSRRRNGCCERNGEKRDCRTQAHSYPLTRLMNRLSR